MSAQPNRSWEGLIDLGDAVLRIGEMAGMAKASEPRARRLYLSAFFRARRDGALPGLVRTAESFARLGDRVLVEQALGVAATVAAETTPDQRDTYRRAAERLRRTV